MRFVFYDARMGALDTLSYVCHFSADKLYNELAE